MSEPFTASDAIDDRVLLVAGTLERYSTSGLLLLPEVGSPVKLNATAATVWECLRAGRRRSETIRVVADAFGQEREMVAPLVEDALDHLIRSGLAYHPQ